MPKEGLIEYPGGKAAMIRDEKTWIDIFIQNKKEIYKE